VCVVAVDFVVWDGVSLNQDSRGGFSGLCKRPLNRLLGCLGSSIVALFKNALAGTEMAAIAGRSFGALGTRYACL
jgi:hypothetical protein